MPDSEPFARLSWQRHGGESVEPALLEVDSVFGGRTSSESRPESMLIESENAAAMARLTETHAGKIDLIYIDPPFLTGRAYRARVGRGEDSRRPDQWQTIPGYTDEWDDGGQYLSTLLPRLRLMHQLLSDRGSLYVHLDWHASAYVRVMLDEIFGPDRFLNEIVWVYHGPSPIRSAFNRKHDTLLVYTKTENYTFNADAVRVPYSDSTVKTFASSDKAGFGKKPDLARGKVPEDWWYFPVVARLHTERTGYPTQKPEALLERIILASSNPNDLVADFYCGSGTAAVVSARHGRRWIACDTSRLAVWTTARRLLLDDPDASFRLLRSADSHPDELRPTWSLSEDGSTLSLSGMDGSSSPQPFPDNLLLWEIDPDHRGQAFRGRQRVVRPIGDDSIRLELELGEVSRESGQVAVRVVDTTGGEGKAILQ
jgi:DNA modification methylase